MGTYIQAGYRKYNAVAPLREIVDKDQKFLLPIPKRNFHALFILPSNDRKSGGVSVIARLVEEITARGPRVGVLSMTGDHSAGLNSKRLFNEFSSIQQIFSEVSDVKEIWATSFDTVPLAVSLAKSFSCQTGYFIQGPEVAFSQGRHARAFLEGIEQVGRIVTVSEYLARYVQLVSGREAHALPFGPDANLYYPRQVERDQQRVAVAVVDTPEKGSGLCILLAEMLRRHGFGVTVFGKSADTYDLPDGVEAEGWLPPDKLARLFSRCSFFVDASIYEGLGLLPLEAAFCGAIPVMPHNGGAADILERSNGALFYSGASGLGDIVHTIVSLNVEETQDLRRRAISTRDRVSFSAGVDKFIDLFLVG